VDWPVLASPSCCKSARFWTWTCSTRCHNSNLISPMPGLELALPAADSSSDHRSFCQAVFCGPTVHFPIGFIPLFHHSYSCDVATLLYIPHTHLTPVLFQQVGNWHCVPAWAGAEVNIAKWKQWVFLVIGVISCTAVEKKHIYCADSRGRHLACLTSSLRVPCQSWKQVFILNSTITQQDPTTNLTYKGSSLKKFVLRKLLHVRDLPHVAP